VAQEPTKIHKDNITLRMPNGTDGSDVWALVRECQPLDENSMYCYLIQCDHFAETCVLAEMNGQPVGWISGYLRPDAPDTLFVWQVAVSAAARGKGLGRGVVRQFCPPQRRRSRQRGAFPPRSAFRRRPCH